MANERFKVKFGLAVGDTAATIDGTTGDIITDGDIQLGGNTIKKSGGTPVIEFSGTNLTTLAGDIEVDGNSIRSSTGAVAIELSGSDIATGDITLNGGDIRSSGGTVAISVSGANATVAGDLFVVGNEIFSSGGNRNLTFSGTNVTVEGDLTVGGNNIKTGDGTTALTFTNVTGSVAVAGDLTVTGGDITTPTSTGTVFNTTATTVRLGEAATTVSIGADTGTTTINNSLVADDISILTVDTTNLEVTNIKAKDGTAAATIADTTGIITVSTQLNVDNINISGNTVSSTNTNGAINLTPNGTGTVVIPTADITNLDVTNIRALDGTAAITVANSTGAVTVSTELNVDNINVSGNTISSTNTNGAINLTPNGTGVVVIPTADITNLDVTNIRALDGTAAASIANTTGAVTITSSLQVDNVDIRGNTISSTDTDGSINLTPNGTGAVRVNTSIDVGTIRALDGTAAATIANTTGAVTVTSQLTVDNININGNTIISTDTNGAIILTPNGTGNILLTTADGGNVVASRNFVDGAIRNANTQARGNIWELLATTPPTAPTGPVSGLSIDNSQDLTKTAGLVLRNYGAAGGNRGRLIFERSRGTAASPSAVVVGDFLGEVDVTGYSTAGWLNDLVAAVPAFYGFNATENWTGLNNCGTQLTIGLQPTATTLGTGTQVTALQLNPQNAALRSDTFTLTQGKTTGFVATGCSITGTTLTIGTVTSGTVATGQFIQNAAGTISPAIFIISGSGSTWTLNAAPGNQTGQTISGRQGFINCSTANTQIINDLRLFTNNIQSNSTTTQIVLSNAGATLELRGDNIQLENAAGTAITGNNITYNRVYGQFEYNTTVTPAAINTAYVFPLGTASSSNIVTVGSTSRLIPGAAGVYNIQFSAQVENNNNQEHTAYIFLRKNGVDVTNSTGQVTILKNSSQIVSWNYVITSANTTDYWELGYAVDNTQIRFPAFASTAFAPSAASIITTITPVGA